MALEQTIGFIGAGKMASALAKGFVRAGLFDPDRVVAGDPVRAARQAFARTVGGHVVENNSEVVSGSQIVVLAVKPNQAGPALEDIKGTLTSQQVLISIVAGLGLARMETALEGAPRIIRAMPNTPALAGASATAYALGTFAHHKDSDLAQTLFSSVGLVVRVKESLLDAVTGLSGSGPAYVFLFIEALSDGGVAAGLPRDIATQLAAQTLLGSAKLLLESGQHPAALKDMVASPGGTTIEGLHHLEKAGFRGAVIGAVRAAADKARLLGQLNH